jgi:hypothetical protein
LYGIDSEILRYNQQLSLSLENPRQSAAAVRRNKDQLAASAADCWHSCFSSRLLAFVTTSSVLYESPLAKKEEKTNIMETEIA